MKIVSGLNLKAAVTGRGLSDGKETLLLTETENTLVVTYEETDEKAKGVGGEEAQIIKYTVLYDKKRLMDFRVNRSTGDVVVGTIKSVNLLEIADFFSQLTQNLIIGDAKSLKSK